MNFCRNFEKICHHYQMVNPYPVEKIVTKVVDRPVPQSHTQLKRLFTLTDQFHNHTQLRKSLRSQFTLTDLCHTQLRKLSTLINHIQLRKSSMLTDHMKRLSMLTAHTQLKRLSPKL
uniref:Uncharacterized protein n=1 Tax=Cacopsylla melanoneura TaxID=428564 RepID=A0A8D9FJ51_9HEMI